MYTSTSPLWAFVAYERVTLISEATSFEFVEQISDSELYIRRQRL